MVDWKQLLTPTTTSLDVPKIQYIAKPAKEVKRPYSGLSLARKAYATAWGTTTNPTVRPFLVSTKPVSNRLGGLTGNGIGDEPSQVIPPHPMGEGEQLPGVVQGAIPRRHALPEPLGDGRLGLHVELGGGDGVPCPGLQVLGDVGIAVIQSNVELAGESVDGGWGH